MSNFFNVRCGGCGAEKMIFSYASTVVKCEVCEAILAEPTGGKADIKTSIIEKY